MCGAQDTGVSSSNMQIALYTCSIVNQIEQFKTNPQQDSFECTPHKITTRLNAQCKFHTTICSDDTAAYHAWAIVLQYSKTLGDLGPNAPLKGYGCNISEWLFMS